MKILIAPLTCPFETAGPMQRAVALAKAFQKEDHEVCFCAAEDRNYQPVKGIRNFPAPIPEPLGLVHPFGKLIMGIVLRAGFAQRREIHSFEQVLHLMGALHPAYFSKDLSCLKSVIDAFNPDVVYSEFRLAAIVQARAQGVHIVGGYSYPAQPTYRSDPKYSTELREMLSRMNLPAMTSALEIFQYQQISFVVSSPSLEPISGDNICHVGPLFSFPEISTNNERKNIVAYLGNSAISPAKALRNLRDAFSDSDYQVYLAAKSIKGGDYGNIHVAPSYDFTSLLPQAAVFVNHGGQNSAMSGLLAGSPQLIFPGKVFERRYNADSIEKIGAGLTMEDEDFSPVVLRANVDKVSRDSVFRQQALSQAQELRKLGGTKQILRKLSSLVEGVK